MGKKLYVGNLSYSTSESDLQRLFEPHGTVESAQIIMDRETGRSKGFAFVEMSTDQEAEAAIEALYGDLLANDPVNFRISVPTLLVQWGADRLIVPESTLALRDSLARKGTPVSFRAYIGATHGSVLAAAADDVAAWLAGRFK